MVNAGERYVRIAASDLTAERLDTGFYAPEYYAALASVGASGYKMTRIGDLCEPWCFGAYALTNLIEWTTATDGVPYFKAESLDSPLVNYAGLSFITLSSHRALPKSRVTPGDIVVSTSGTVGRVCVVPASIPEANSNQDTIKFNPSSKTIDNHYVAALITSRFGQTFMNREAGGSVQQHIYLHNFKRLPLVFPSYKAQLFIGAKVRLAEALRDRAQTLLSDAHAFFDELHQFEGDNRRGIWRRPPATIAPGRLDASFYAPAVVELLATLIKHTAEPVSKHATLIHSRSFKAHLPIRYFEIGGVDIASGLAWPVDLAAGDVPSRAQRSVRPWDILVATVRPERKNVGIVPEFWSGQLVASSGFAVLRATEAWTAAFLWCYLRSDASTEQLLRWNTGAAYPAIDDDVALHLLIPRYSPEVIRAKGERWSAIPPLLTHARALVTAARLIVEALIERKVSEAELIAASTDPAADRALLARLTNGGLDAPGEPLFPDLDALSALLATAKSEP